MNLTYNFSPKGEIAAFLEKVFMAWALMHLGIPHTFISSLQYLPCCYLSHLHQTNKFSGLKEHRILICFFVGWGHGCGWPGFPTQSPVGRSSGKPLSSNLEDIAQSMEEWLGCILQTNPTKHYEVHSL